MSRKIVFITGIVIMMFLWVFGCNSRDMEDYADDEFNSDSTVEQGNLSDIILNLGKEIDRETKKRIESGSLIFSTEYEIEDYFAGYYIVSKLDGKLFGVLGSTGEEILPVKYDDIDFVNLDELRKGIDTEVYFRCKYEGRYSICTENGDKIIDEDARRITQLLGEVTENTPYFYSEEEEYMVTGIPRGIITFYNKEGEIIYYKNILTDMFDSGYINKSGKANYTNCGEVSGIHLISDKCFMVTGILTTYENSRYVSDIYIKAGIYNMDNNSFTQIKTEKDLLYNPLVSADKKEVAILVVSNEKNMIYTVSEECKIEVKNIEEQDKYYFSTQKELKENGVKEKTKYSGYRYLGKNDEFMLYSTNDTWKLVNQDNIPLYEDRYFECFSADEGYFLLNADSEVCLISSNGNMVITPGIVEWNGSKGYFMGKEVNDDNLFEGIDDAVIIVRDKDVSEVYYFYANDSMDE